MTVTGDSHVGAARKNGLAVPRTLRCMLNTTWFWAFSTQHSKTYRQLKLPH